MTIVLGPELASLLASIAQDRGQTPEDFAREVLAERVQAQVNRKPPLSREEFLRHLDAMGRPCGISLTDEQLSRETMYD